MSVCIRCGKQRVVVSSRQETVFKSTVVYTETACPDPECQKLVDKGLKTEELKRVMLKDEQEKRAFQRMAAKKVVV